MFIIKKCYRPETAKKLGYKIIDKRIANVSAQLLRDNANVQIPMHVQCTLVLLHGVLDCVKVGFI